MLHAVRSRRAGSGERKRRRVARQRMMARRVGDVTGRQDGERRSDELRSRHIMRLRGGCARWAGRHLCPAAAARRFWKRVTTTRDNRRGATTTGAAG